VAEEKNEPLKQCHLYQHESSAEHPEIRKPVTPVAAAKLASR
jgi:hypothetical protein